MRGFVKIYCNFLGDDYGMQAPGTGLTRTLPPSLRYVAKILYEIMLEVFLYLTKPSKRAIHGAVLLAPASMPGRFCVSWA